MKHFARNIILAIVVIGAMVAAFQYMGPSGGSIKPHGGHGHGAGDHAHGEGKVELSDAKVAASGIELVTAGPATLHESVLLNGILQPNQEALAQVTPRFPGIIREISKRVGDRVEKNEILGKIESNQSLTVYDLRAPFGGTVIERQAALGEFASEQKPVFVIADLSTVWADFAVYRRDLGRIQPGNTVIVSTDDGLPPLEGKLAYVAPVGSAETQTALARAVLPNGERRLRPGLFVTGRVLLSARPAQVAIKTSALQTIENRTVVFVRSGDAFEARDVEIGHRDAEHAEILFGIMEGDVYAAKNSFVIKAELGKASAAHEH
ncbi:MAG: efflux RND transporter periplasmic adaptor subunit [Xanthobacteraceae bacterium]|nr:efflux RND transporter periplasmic adaptor subunit [Xanthobacteraceae bacterium]